jgi:hypothetical protein
VADRDGRNAAAAFYGVVDRDVVDADNAKYMLDAKGTQGLVDGLAARHLAHRRTSQEELVAARV